MLEVDTESQHTLLPVANTTTRAMRQILRVSPSMDIALPSFLPKSVHLLLANSRPVRCDVPSTNQKDPEFLLLCRRDIVFCPAH